MLDNAEVPLQIEGFDVDFGFGTDYLPLGPGMDDYVLGVALDTFGLSSYIDPGSSTSGYSSPSFMGSSDACSPFPFIPEMVTDQPQRAMNPFPA